MKPIAMWAACLATLFMSTAGAEPSSDAEAPKNTPPEISSYGKVWSKVSPVAGNSGDKFEFGVDYRDADGEPCKPCQVWIDIDHDGVYGENEKFNMELYGEDEKAVSPGDRVGLDWRNWKHFYVKLPVTNEQMGVPTKFRFYFSDGTDEANGLADYIKEQKMMVRPQIFVGQTAGTFDTVPGGLLRLEFPVYLEKNITRQVAFKWEDIEQMKFPKGVKLSSYKVITRKVNRDYDVALLTLILDIDRSVSTGAVALKFVPVHYVRTMSSVGPTQPAEKQPGVVQFTPLQFRVAAQLVSIPVVTAKALTLGTAFDQMFAISLGADTADKDAIVQALNAQTFLPFIVVSRSVVVTTQPGGATEISVRNVLALDGGVPGQYQISGFNVGSLAVPPAPIIMFPIDPPAKVPESPDEMNALIKSIRTIAAPVIPSGASQPRMSPVYFSVGGGVVLAVLAFLFGRMGLRWQRNRELARRQESLRRAQYEAYRSAKDAFKESESRTNLATLYHELRELVLASYNRSDIADGVHARELAGVLGVSGSNEQLDELQALEDRYFHN